MAPFDNPSTAKLTTKISPVFTDAMPEFVVSEHPIFVDFLKAYYEFLESAELQLTVTIDNFLLETFSAASLLDEDGNEIVLENANGTTGKFTVGETITGATSNATATILADDLGNETKPRIFITSSQQFITGETITGATSSSTGVIVKYRANPIQNIQQLLEYANVDNTIYDFLDNMRDAFMTSLPDDLADGLDKRNIIKNIKDLYSVKGTSEGHKLFMKMLLNDDVDITYPNEYIIRASDGSWSSKKTLRTISGPNSLASETIGQTVTGLTSGATAIVASADIVTELGIEITEIELDADTIVGTFQDDETVTAISNTTDLLLTFTVKDVLNSVSITDNKRGSLYSVGDQFDFENRGNNKATAEVSELGTGTISDIYVDGGGTDYKVGDRIIFTTGDDEVSTESARGVVSIVDGAMLLDGSDGDSTDTGDFIVFEDGTSTHLEPFGVQLEDSVAGVEPFSVFGTDILRSDTKGYYYPLYLTFKEAQRANDGSPAGVAHKHTFEEYKNQEFFMPSNFSNHAKSTNVTSLTINSVTETITLFGTRLLLNRTDTSGVSGTGDSATGGLDDRSLMLMDDSIELDEYKTDGDRIAIEFGTDTQNESISRAVVLRSGGGYKKLPTATVSSEFGSSAQVYGITNDIGSIESISLRNTGFDYEIIPDVTARANFQIKNVTGEFKVGEALTSHTGTVRSYDATRQILQVSFEDVVRTELETTDAIPMELEDTDSSGDAISGIDKTQKSILVVDGHLRSEALITEDGDYIVTDAEFVTDFNIKLEDDVTLRQEGTKIEGVTNIINHADVDGEYFLLENSNGVVFGVGDRIVTDASEINTENDGSSLKLVLDGTDSSGSNAGGSMVNETDSGSIDILLEDIAGSVQGRLLQEITPQDGAISLNGIDTSSTHEGDNLIHELEEIDFSAGTTTISTTSGTATIVNTNIAKTNATIGTLASANPEYDTFLSHIGHDLIRLQDSFFYQQFSYEVVTAYGSNEWLNALRKSVHPAGFAVFGKIQMSSRLNVKPGTIGASLGGGVAHPTSASVITSIVDVFDSVQDMSHQVTSFASTQIRLPIVNGMTTGGIETISQSLFEENGILLEDGVGTILLDGYAFNAPMYRNLRNVILYSSQTGSETYGANFVDSNVKMLLEEKTATQEKTTPIISDFNSYSTDFLVLNGSNGSSANAGENMLLEDATIFPGNSSSENRLVSEDKFNFGYSIGDILRTDLLILNEHANEVSTDDEVMGILFEDSEDTGSFRLEDETTNATSFAGYLIVEGGTPPHNTNTKFLLETTRIELESENQKGTVSLQSRSTNGKRFARPTLINVKET